MVSHFWKHCCIWWQQKYTRIQKRSISAGFVLQLQWLGPISKDPTAWQTDIWKTHTVVLTVAQYLFCLRSQNIIFLAFNETHVHTCVHMHTQTHRWQRLTLTNQEQKPFTHQLGFNMLPKDNLTLSQRRGANNQAHNWWSAASSWVPPPLFVEYLYKYVEILP